MNKYLYLISLLALSTSTSHALTPQFNESTSPEVRVFLTACSEGLVATLKASFTNDPSQIAHLLQAKDTRGVTGLMFLAQYGSKEGIELLLQHCNYGEEYLRHEYRPGEYYTARTYAEAEGNPEIADLLPEDN